MANFPPLHKPIGEQCDDRPRRREESFAEETLIQAIENQIDSESPPAARAVFNKLSLVGYEREDA
ncbi:hypothetical protein D0N87_31925, partial [Pseudomonas sp. ATCC 13867]